MNIPPCCKPVTPVLRRAEELDKSTEPLAKVLAYFCRAYAMDVGMKLPGGTSAEGMQFLSQLIEKLESDKKAIPPTSQQEGKDICERFALDVFESADAEYRAGSANQKTAKTFFQASVYIEILNQFGEVDQELVQKRLYAKLKATEILKAVKEGKPIPGVPDPPVEHEGSIASSTVTASTSSYTLDTNPGTPTANTYYSPSHHQQQELHGGGSAPQDPVAPPPPPAVDISLGPPITYSLGDVYIPPAPQQPTPTASIRMPAPAPNPSPVYRGAGGKGSRVPASALADALELTRFALSALEHKDTDLGAQRLREALQQLER